MFVKEYMTKTPIVLSTKDDVKDAFALLLENRIRQAPVLENGKLTGIVTDRDLRMALVQNLKVNNLTVGLAMTKDPVTVTGDTKITDAGKIISIGKFNAIPVIEKSGQLIGIITTTDILNYFIEQMEDEYENLIST